MEELRGLPEDYLEPLLPCLDLIKRCNVTFFDNGTLFNRYWRYFYIIPCVVAFYIFLSAYMMQVFEGQLELSELAYVVSVYVVSNQAIVKAIIVVLKSKEIRSIILELGQAWRTEDLSDAQINKKKILLKRLNFVSKAFYWMNIIGSWQYMLTPLCEILIRKYVLKQEPEHVLPFSCKFPFDPTANWPTYLGVYSFQTYSMFLIVYCYVGVELLMVNLCAHISTEFALLHEDLRNLTPLRNSKGKGLGNGIRKIVRHHVKLIRLSQQLDNIFNIMIFINLSSVTFTICFFGFAAKVARTAIEKAKNFIGVIALIVQIFNLCYYAELLQDASSTIADAAYENLWYNGGIDHQKNLLFIIKRSQNPCSLTSMKYSPIALNTFTAILSTAWSYFSLISSLYEGETT
ncbi:odorant receptor 4 [Bombyx mori]|uniref:Odorant receptor n=1 Tax=Bombyx mori TaxID=7091 RepID=A0A8R2DK51_BOMMO|nr:odorant receptor 4 [Bombyx mori]